MKVSVYSIIKVVLFLVLIASVILLFSLIGMILYSHDHESSYVTGNTANTNPVIIIDAGHGGEDGGAEANGLIEKNINLFVALFLKNFILLSDTNCAMTRNEDVLLYNVGEENNKKRHDILNRIRFAEKYDGGIFVSIHQNKFEIPKYKGLQVYYSTNNVSSSVLAEYIQSNSKKYLDDTNTRKTKPSDYRIKVLDKLKIPAVLVECGFISNPEEASKLSTAEYQKKIAFITYLSLVEYINNGDYNEK